MKKNIITIILLLIGIKISYAQHEFGVNVGTGLSTLQYKPDIGSKTVRMGTTFGLDYAYFFDSNWAIRSGIDFAFYNAKYSNSWMNLGYLISTPNDLINNFYLRAEYSEYREKQKTVFLQVPIMAQFQTPFLNHDFYAMGGLRLGFPISKKYTSSAESITTTGYSDQTGQVFEDMPKYGFDSYEGVNSSGKLNFKVSCMISLETGIKWRIAEKYVLYTGFYFDYGLNNVGKSDNQNLISYNENSPTNYDYNSLLHTEIGNKVRPFAVGIKVRFNMGI